MIFTKEGCFGMFFKSSRKRQLTIGFCLFIFLFDTNNRLSNAARTSKEEKEILKTQISKLSSNILRLEDTKKNYQFDFFLNGQAKILGTNYRRKCNPTQ